ncbi:MAG: SGNH/GDSL hydrolase family protein [Anaerolineae bacterium]
MKSRNLLVFTVCLLAVLLIVSLGLNCYLYHQGRLYYLQMNLLSLDPLGLDYYETASELQGPDTSDVMLVTFFGDSRAASWPAPEVGSFEFVNRGIGAQTSEQAALRFDYHVKPLDPDIIIVQVGVNDLKTIPLFPERQESIISDCKGNIQQIVERSTDLGAVVIVSTIFPIGEVPIERRPFWSDDVARAINEVNAYIRSLEREGVIVFDAYSILADENGVTDSEYSRDLLHLNDAGYTRLNGELVQILMTIE